MSPITSLLAREILDSRGNPTVEVELSDGTHTATAAVPSGASTGSHEALELRDGDKGRYLGKGVLKAVENANTVLAKAVIGLDPADQETLDRTMIDLDGTDLKQNLGANAILGISLAAARLAAQQKGIELYKHIESLFRPLIANSQPLTALSKPRPMMNIINGGAHADSGLAVQEFMVIPQCDSFEDMIRAGAEIFHTLKKLLSSAGHAVGVGDEGGFAPHLPTVKEALEVIVKAIYEAGYTTDNTKIALDAAASEFYQDGTYTVDKKPFTNATLVDFYAQLIEDYPIVSIEDSHHEDDFEGFQMMQDRFGDKIQLVGDDLLVTNKKRLQKAIDEKLCNAILIKVNQIGTLTETLETIALAKAHDFGVVISHRSGETEDTFIADLSVGTAAGQIKTGSLCRSERVGKYNRLMRIRD